MRNKSLDPIVYPFALLLFSCSPKPANDVLLKELTGGLASSTALATIQAENTIEHFKNKLADPATSEKAKVWYPKILKIHEATAGLFKLIDSVKAALETGVDGNGKSKSVNDVLIANEKYKELYQQLKQYRQQVLFADSMRLNELKNYTVIISKEQDTTENANFLKQCLVVNPPYGALAYLNLLKNNLAIAEARCIAFYNEQVIAHRPWYYLYEAILTQNTKILRAGDSLELTGGVGSISGQRLLQFSVNGKDIEPNDRGLAIYKFKTSKKLGSYSVRVHIRMLDEDNVEQTRTFAVDYTLVDEIKKH